MEKEQLAEPGEEYLLKGCANLEGHIENLKKFGVPVIVALNRFGTDTTEEMLIVKQLCDALGVKFSVCDSFEKGGWGAAALAKEVKALAEENAEPKINYLYDLQDDFKDKITKIAVDYYGASKVEFSKQAIKRLKQVEKLIEGLPVCMAKTQYSFSDDPALLGRPTDFVFHISDIEYRAGAKFVVVISKSILLMFGLPKVPNACKMTIDSKGRIEGLY